MSKIGCDGLGEREGCTRSKRDLQKIKLLNQNLKRRKTQNHTSTLCLSSLCLVGESRAYHEEALEAALGDVVLLVRVAKPLQRGDADASVEYTCGGGGEEEGKLGYNNNPTRSQNKLAEFEFKILNVSGLLNILRLISISHRIQSIPGKLSLENFGP